MNPLGWYPHDVAAWLTDEKVRRMGYLARGVYHDLMMLQWIEGSIPAALDDIRSSLSRPADPLVTDDVLAVVLECFPPLREDHLGPLAQREQSDSLPPTTRRANPKLELIRRERLDTYKKKVDNARRCANKRLRALAQREQNDSLSDSLSSRSPAHIDPPLKRYRSTKSLRTPKSVSGIGERSEAQSSRSGEREPKDVAQPNGNYVAQAIDIWREKQGEPVAGELGKALKPLVALHGVDLTLAHFARFTSSPDARFGFHWFAKHFKTFSPQSNEGLEGVTWAP